MTNVITILAFFWLMAAYVTANNNRVLYSKLEYPNITVMSEYEMQSNFINYTSVTLMILAFVVIGKCFIY